MNTPTSEPAVPLDDVMLAMDVVDTLRHADKLVARELDADTRRQQLAEKLKEIYHQQGIEVSDAVIAEGVAALAEQRFVYTPPRAGIGVTLARLYVRRGKWGPWAAAIVLVLVLGLAGYVFGYVPYQRAQMHAAQVELTQKLPEEMDALYQSIYEETKVQVAVTRAEEIRTRGKTAVKEGDRAGAERAVADLRGIRDTLRQEYTLQIVNRSGEKSGFWTFPEVNTAATNYYVVVEAVNTDGKVIALPIKNEETGKTETVTKFGVRVPQSVYMAVQADKKDDGIIERDIVGIKQYGFLDVDYVVPVLGGKLTRW